MRSQKRRALGMANPLERQPARASQSWLARGRRWFLIGLIFVIVAVGSIGLFTPSIRDLVAAPFIAYPASSSHATTGTGNTSMFGFDAQHTHFNPGEHILNYTNVSRLVPDWTSLPTGGSIFSSPVIANGVVYVA